MYRSIRIADYFIYKSVSEKEEGIDLLKLIKLVYLANGWYLALSKNGSVSPLIDENPEAWTYGPVVPTVYDTFKEYDEPIAKEMDDEFADFNERDLHFLQRIWEVYGSMESVALSEKTHKRGTAWYFARLQGKSEEHHQISMIDIRKKFLQQYNKNKKDKNHVLEKGKNTISQRVCEHCDAVYYKSF